MLHEAVYGDRDQCDFIWKVVLIGDYGVGKSTMYTRYTGYDMLTPYNLGMDFYSKITHIKDKKIKAQIWDTVGQERFFKAFSRGYFRGAAGVLLVYDITDRLTYQNADRWLTDVREHADDDTVIMLVGNKSDQSTNRAVLTDEAQAFAEKNHLLFMETSALDSRSVETAFHKLLTEIYKTRMHTKTDASYPSQKGLPDNKPQGSWCYCW